MLGSGDGWPSVAGMCLAQLSPTPPWWWLVLIALMLLQLAMSLGTRARLRRIERRLAAAESESSAGDEGATVEARPGGDFERFLDEDPARRELSKREQSEAYRRWRRERGLNWDR